MYVPPTTGSAILVWYAVTPTNWIVLRGIRYQSHQPPSRSNAPRERAQNIQDDESHKHSGAKRRGRQEVHECHRRARKEEARPERVVPRPQRFVRIRPFGGVVAADELAREVDEDGKREVGLAHALLDEFEARHGVVRLKSDFGNKMEKQEELHVCIALRVSEQIIEKMETYSSSGRSSTLCRTPS